MATHYVVELVAGERREKEAFEYCVALGVLSVNLHALHREGSSLGDTYEQAQAEFSVACRATALAMGVPVSEYYNQVKQAVVGVVSNVPTSAGSAAAKLLEIMTEHPLNGG